MDYEYNSKSIDNCKHTKLIVNNNEEIANIKQNRDIYSPSKIANKVYNDNKINHYNSKNNLLIDHIDYNLNIELNKLKKMQKNKNIIMFFIILSSVYFFSSSTLLIANTQNIKTIDVYFLPFHNLDFLGSLVFAIVEAMALIYAEIIVFGEPRFFLVFFNVGLTFVAAALFLIKADYWEITSHWIEFSAQVFLTSIDLVFITAQFKDNSNPLYKYRYFEIILVIILLISSIIKLFIYGNIIRIYDIDGEQMAHYLEFIGEMINTSFAVMFLLVYYNILNKRIIDKKEQIKYVDEE